MEALGLHHVSISTNDFDASKAFYTELLGQMGAQLAMEAKGPPHRDPEGRFALFAGKSFMFGIWETLQEFRSNKFQMYNVGLHHIAFAAPSREAVDQLHQKLSSSGAKILDAPAEYPYAPGYYAVYFTDPDGHKLEYVHLPQ